MKHDARVGCVSARRDSGDNNRSVLKSVLLAIMLEVCGGSKLILGDTEALEANGVGEASLEIRGHAVHIDLIVRALGSRKGGLDISKAEFHDVT